LYTFVTHFYASFQYFNQDISDWDVSLVTNFGDMFYYSTSFNKDISNWNVSQGVNLDGMFASATSFNQNLNPWNQHIQVASSVLSMFTGASSCPTQSDPSGTPFKPLCHFSCFTDKPTLTTVIGQNYADPNAYPYATYGAIEDWCFDAALTDFSSLFQGKTGFNSDLGQWVRSFKLCMLLVCNCFITLTVLLIPPWLLLLQLQDVSVSVLYLILFVQVYKELAHTVPLLSLQNVVSMNSMFDNSSFNSDISTWNTAAVTDMSYMFQDSVSAWFAWSMISICLHA
jgi:surface protein